MLPSYLCTPLSWGKMVGAAEEFMEEWAVNTHLCMLELQLCQLNEILTERGDPARLEVHELWGEERKGVKERGWVFTVGWCQPSGLTLFGRVREALEALAAQLLVALCWLYFPVPSPSFVQCLVSILVVGQCPKPPVQQVLRPSAADDGSCHGFCS